MVMKKHLYGWASFQFIQRTKTIVIKKHHFLKIIKSFWFVHSFWKSVIKSGTNVWKTQREEYTTGENNQQKNIKKFWHFLPEQNHY